MKRIVGTTEVLSTIISRKYWLKHCKMPWMGYKENMNDFCVFEAFLKMMPWYIILNQMKIIFLILLILWLGHAGYYCRSKCSANSNSGCRYSGPQDCSNCISTYYTSCNVIRTGFTLVEEAIVTNLTSTWNNESIKRSLSRISVENIKKSIVNYQATASLQASAIINYYTVCHV